MTNKTKNDHTIITGIWLTSDDEKYKMSTGIGNEPIEIYRFEPKGQFIHETFELRRPDDKIIRSGTFEIDSANNLLFLTLTKKTGTIDKLKHVEAVPLPFETAVRYRVDGDIPIFQNQKQQTLTLTFVGSTSSGSLNRFSIKFIKPLDLKLGTDKLVSLLNDGNSVQMVRPHKY